MKQKLLNLKALLLVLVASFFAGNALATDETITLSSGSYSSTAKDITWTGTSCTINQAQGSSNTAVSSDYVSAPRWYKSHVITFKANSGYTITGATVVCTSNSYANALQGSTYSTGASATVSSSTVTITTSGDFTITMGAQARISSIKVSYNKSGSVSATAPTLTDACVFTTSTYDVTITNQESGATVYYTTDGTDPTTSSSSFTGDSKTITIDKLTTVKAMAAISGKDNSSIASALYETPIANTEETAYTTAEAIAWINSGSTQLATEVYVKGTVSKVDSYNSTYGSLTYWLDDNAFEVYSGLNKDGEKFTGTTDLQAGDEVVVKGTITKFNSTYEFNKNNVLVSRKTTATQETPTFTLGTYKSTMVAGADDEYSVTTNSDGKVTVTSSDENVAEAIVVEGTVMVSAKAAGTTTITVAAAETETYYAASKTYTLTVIEAASLPFYFDGNGTEASTTKGVTTKSLGSYTSTPKIKFDGTGDYLVVTFNESAKYVGYTIKGNSFSNSMFDIQESADGVNYTNMISYQEMDKDATYMTLEPQAETRYIKFVYTNKSAGNVALGAITIAKEYPTAKMDITSMGCATFCAPFDVDLTDAAEVYNVKAYTADAVIDDGWVKLTEVENNLIPAGTPVVLYGDEYSDTFSGTPTAGTAKKGVLTGNLGTEKTEIPTGSYILQNNSLGTGWYEVKNDPTQLYVGVNRCYMTYTASGAREYYPMTVGETTAVNSIAAQAETKADGKYLVNGRVVVVKAGKAYNMNGQAVK